MDQSTFQLFQRVRLTRDQERSAGQQGWTGTIMDCQPGDDHAQVEIDARYAAQMVVGVALADLEAIAGSEG